MAESTSSNNRLLYIDKLKALAMLLVVMGHCIYFCMHHEQTFSDSVFSIICTFHVPLFFFLSGVVIRQAPTPQKFFGKARRFLMPMLVVGVINALLIGRLKDFFLNGGHNGYWYLLTLTVFYLLLVPFQLTKDMRGLKGFICDSVLAIVLWRAIIMANSVDWLQPLNTWGAYAFWPFFIGGYIVRKHDLLSFLTEKWWLTALLTLAYLTLLVVSFDNIAQLPLWLDFTLAATAIGALLGLFHAFSQCTTFIDRQLLLIGNSTLDIYIYHYFFIRFIDLNTLRQENLAVELAVIIPLTVAITYGSIVVGMVVRHAGQLITGAQRQIQ